MEQKVMDLIKNKCGEENYKKLAVLNNQKVYDFVAKYIQQCNPDRVFVRTDSAEDALYIRNKAIENGEEKKLAINGHTVHFDGYYDQARDKDKTRYLLEKGIDLGPSIKGIDREKGLDEVHEYLKDSMSGKEMYVCFFCLGPLNSKFSISCVQITDSSYVAHSEGILYRSGYSEFKRKGNFNNFFRFIHSAGVIESGVSKDVAKRCIYIDLGDRIVFSTNTQYAGNTVGLKKLALRLAIYQASGEDWLAEHMFVMGVHNAKGRVTYFTGAFPSACGKTSTSMLTGETIIGDDIAYLRTKEGKAYAVNVESGIFGIIRDVNSQGDPLIWEVLNSPGEVIFSNVLVTEKGVPSWLGNGSKIPESGINYSGEWTKGQKDSQGKEITSSHKNARYTVSISRLKNRDVKADDPGGVLIGGVIYGGRDSNISVPVQEAFDWKHGVLTMGASLESETTAATLGQEGVRKFNLMSNLDFLSIPLSKYINKHLDFGSKLNTVPVIFAVNYFLKDNQGNYLNGKEDKHVWLKWMEQRIHKEIEAIKTPTGFIPKYEDLKRLFKEVLDRNYTKEDYIKQFTLSVDENIAKIERIVTIYKTKVTDAPQVLFEVLQEQKQKLEEIKTEHGNYASPELLDVSELKLSD